MRQNLFVAFCLPICVFVIFFGGYNCTQKFYEPVQGDRQEQLLNNDEPVVIGEENPGSLPATATGRCDRSAYRKLEDDHGGDYAFIDIDRSNFAEYRFGEEPNFEPGCPRVLVNMNRISSGDFKGRYKGELVLTYEGASNSNPGERALKKQVYTSGKLDEANQYNEWAESKISDSGQEFVAFFENSRDPRHGKQPRATSLILYIDDIDEVPVDDGTNEYFAEGTVYFKMFRMLARRGDTCITGAFMSEAHTPPPQPKNKLFKEACWLLSFGGWSCRPDGAHSQITEDAIRNPSCYKRFGKFERLNVLKAFNIDDPGKKIR